MQSTWQFPDLKKNIPASKSNFELAKDFQSPFTPCTGVTLETHSGLLCGDDKPLHDLGVMP
jgi:hypothetical protein